MLKIDKDILNHVKRIHFIGIGGSGMFPMVQILHGQGYLITGSDCNTGTNVDAEIAMGIPVMIGHNKDNICGTDLVIYSAAISKDNPELCAAIEQGIPTVERAEMLGLITTWYKNCIGVCGTHGKTTSSGMLTQVLLDSGADPTAVIGGRLPAIGGNGRSGKSQHMVCEACEFQDTFLHLSPDIVLILNVDADHLDYFKTLDNVIASFRKFAGMASHAVVVNGDDSNSLKAVEGIQTNCVTYGLQTTNDYYAENIICEGMGSSYTLMYRGEPVTEIKLKVAGMHNVCNSLGVCAVALLSGVTPQQLSETIQNFTGTGRRFEMLGKARGIAIMDDFAHHPQELTVTLQACKKLGYNQVWAVFQPYTYSRTALLLEGFAEALSLADHVVMTEIVSAREENTYNIYTKDLAEKIPGSCWFTSFEEIADYVMAQAKPGDLVITMGGGDIYKCAKMMLHY